MRVAVGDDLGPVSSCRPASWHARELDPHRSVAALRSAARGARAIGAGERPSRARTRAASPSRSVARLLPGVADRVRLLRRSVGVRRPHALSPRERGRGRPRQCRLRAARRCAASRRNRTQALDAAARRRARRRRRAPEPFGAFINIGGLDGLRTSEIRDARVCIPATSCRQEAGVKCCAASSRGDGWRASRCRSTAAPDPWIEGVTQSSRPGRR